LPAHGEHALPGLPRPLAGAGRLAVYEMLRPTPQLLEGVEPLSLQWFLDIENVRHGRHGRWVPRLLEFAKHRGEALLGLGLGLGTDWVQYARHGAEVVACSPSAEHLDLVRKNFELRSLRATAYLHVAPAALPLEAASIDVACLTGVLHEVPDPAAVVAEVYRVLKPGGKVLALVPARFDVDFWSRCYLPWLARPRPREALPLAAEEGGARFSARSLRRLFHRFIEPSVYKRHLRRAEVPHLWRLLPLPLLERLLGRLLLLKAFKPLSAAITEPLAA
jgi:SAM-dependent methyltransferase